MSERVPAAYSLGRLIAVAIGIGISAWVLVTAKNSLYPTRGWLGLGLSHDALGLQDWFTSEFPSACSGFWPCRLSLVWLHLLLL